MKNLINLGVVAGALALTAATAFADGDSAAGKVKSQTCMGCHGIPNYTNVYPTYHVPRLGGQHAAYIVAALKAYKAGLRDHDTMHANAAGLNEQDMADIAAYFESIQ
jgi:cytochrome c553